MIDCETIEIGWTRPTREPKDSDQYSRKIAICRVYGEDLGAWMVGLGWAVAYRSFSTRYVPEDLARRRKAGMWAGSFTPRAEWRKFSRPRLNQQGRGSRRGAASWITVRCWDPSKLSVH